MSQTANSVSRRAGRRHFGRSRRHLYRDVCRRGDRRTQLRARQEHGLDSGPSYRTIFCRRSVARGRCCLRRTIPYVPNSCGVQPTYRIADISNPILRPLAVVECFKMIDDGKTLQAIITVDDLGAFNMPWTAIQRWRRVSDRPMTEMICAENNLNFFNYEVVLIPQADNPGF